MDNISNRQSASGAPIPVRRALRKLGHDIRDARRRRRIPVAIMAERASISRMTLNKVEKGEPGVSMGTYAAGGASLRRAGRGTLSRRAHCHYDTAADRAAATPLGCGARAERLRQR